MLLLRVLPEEERFSVCPLETLLRVELPLLRVEPELPLPRLEVVLLLRLVVLSLLRLELLRSFRLLELSFELLLVFPLSRLEPEVVVLPLVGLRLELEEPEPVSGRRPELRSPSTLFPFPFLSGTTSLFGFPLPDGVDGLTEVDSLFPDSGRGRVDVPGRVVVPGRVDVPGREVPGRVVDEPGREELPGRVGALCGRVEVFGRNWTEPKSERR